MRKELLKGLSEEQIKKVEACKSSEEIIELKVEACKSSEEIIELAKAEGIELTDEQLEAVSGGNCFTSFEFRKCPECGSKYHDKEPIEGSDGSMGYRCERCGHFWTES